jgi:hypothetical protein
MVPTMVQYIQVDCFLTTIDDLNAQRLIIRKFFTFIVLLNLVGLILVITDVWQYPRQYAGALALGNICTAILVRNELFGRLLYLSVNKLFAKVRRIPTLSFHKSHAF